MLRAQAPKRHGFTGPRGGPNGAAGLLGVQQGGSAAKLCGGVSAWGRRFRWNCAFRRCRSLTCGLSAPHSGPVVGCPGIACRAE